MQSGSSNLGPQGFCVCVKCGAKTPHKQGIPCKDMKCPSCGGAMLREGSYHHNLFLEKKLKNIREEK